MSGRVYKLDAPYYDGEVLVRSEDIKAVVRGTNGGVTLLLDGGGSVRVVDNDKTSAFINAAGFRP